MQPAARVGDPTGHPGVLTGPGNPTVLIGGMPVCTVGDLHTCSFPPPPVHPPTPIAKGSGTTPQDINQLMNQFRQTQKMMKQFSKSRNPRALMNMFK